MCLHFKELPSALKLSLTITYMSTVNSSNLQQVRAYDTLALREVKSGQRVNTGSDWLIRDHDNKIGVNTA